MFKCQVNIGRTADPPRGKQWHIYGLVDPRNDVVRYVGRSVNPVARFQSHVSRASSHALFEWLSELEELGTRPRLLVISVVPLSSNPVLEEMEEIARRHVVAVKAGTSLLNLVADEQTVRRACKAAGIKAVFDKPMSAPYTLVRKR